MTIRLDAHIHIRWKTAVKNTNFEEERDPNVNFVNTSFYSSSSPDLKVLRKCFVSRTRRKNAFFPITQYGLDPSNAVSSALPARYVPRQ